MPLTHGGIIWCVIAWLAYTRVSRVGDREETLISPALQQQRIAAYAAAKGLDIEELDPELDVSGGRVERPVLDEAIARVERGEAAGIIVAQLDRLSRMDIVDALHVIRRIEAAGGEVIAVAENFDATTPEGRLGRNVFLALGEMQLDRYKLQFKAAKRQAVERGIWPTSRVPIGYRLDDDRHLEPDPRQAPRIAAAFRRRARGESWAELGRFLAMTPSGAGRVIANRVYLGEVGVTIAGERVVNACAHPAIVDRALWESAQLHKPRPSRRGNGEPALLAGIVRCASCGCMMTRGDRAYRCFPNKAAGRCPAPAHIKASTFEVLVEDAVREHLRAMAVTATARTDEVEVATRALEAAEAELAAYQEAIDIAGVGAEHFAIGMRRRVTALEQARASLGRARGSLTALPGALSAEETWAGLSGGERRHVLGSALGVVWVWKGRGLGRVKIVARGYEPANLSRPGNHRAVMVGVKWGDLPGEIRPAGAQDVEQAPGDAGA